MVRPGPSLARAPLRDRPCAAGRRTWRRPADLDLRARGTSLFQQPGDGRRRWRDAGRLSQEPYPGRAGLYGEILFPARRHRLQGLGHPLRAPGRRHLLGPVVSRSGEGDDPDGRAGPALSHRHRIGAARPPARHRPSLAPRHAGPCRLQCDPGRGGQPHRIRTLAGLSERRAVLLRLQFHRRSPRRSDGAVRPRRRGRLERRIRPGFPDRPPRGLGFLPRSPSRPLRRPDPGPAGPSRAARHLRSRFQSARRPDFARTAGAAASPRQSRRAP